MIRGFLYWLGLTDVSGRPYAFWSGFGGDLGLLAGAAALLHHKNCHARRCWRLGRHPIDGTPWVVCHRHHPDLGERPSKGA